MKMFSFFLIQRLDKFLLISNILINIIHNSNQIDYHFELLINKWMNKTFKINLFSPNLNFFRNELNQFVILFKWYNSLVWLETLKCSVY